LERLIDEAASSPSPTPHASTPATPRESEDLEPLSLKTKTCTDIPALPSPPPALPALFPSWTHPASNTIRHMLYHVGRTPSPVTTPSHGTSPRKAKYKPVAGDAIDKAVGRVLTVGEDESVGQPLALTDELFPSDLGIHADNIKRVGPTKYRFFDDGKVMNTRSVGKVERLSSQPPLEPCSRWTCRKSLFGLAVAGKICESISSSIPGEWRYSRGCWVDPFCSGNDGDSAYSFEAGKEHPEA